MTTAAYTITVHAYTKQDAPDMARRWAERDGWTALKRPPLDVHPVGVHQEGKLNGWSVTIAVERA
jgi:hypothetical protein